MSADSRPVSMLAVMAHPDAGELRADGTLTLQASDAAVTLAVNEHEPARMAEAAAGAAIPGVQLQPLAVPCTAAAIVDLSTATRPEVLITHLSQTSTPVRDIAETVLAALPEAIIATGHPRRVYTTDTYNSLTLVGPVNAHAIIDITPAYEQKRRALAAHGGTPAYRGAFRTNGR